MLTNNKKTLYYSTQSTNIYQTFYRDQILLQL